MSCSSGVDGNDKYAPLVTGRTERRETDSMKMARESPKTMDQRGGRERVTRVSGIDARGEDNSSKSSRGSGSECRDAGTVSKERDGASISSRGKYGVSEKNDKAKSPASDGNSYISDYLRSWFVNDDAVKSAAGSAAGSVPSASGRSQGSKISPDDMAHWSSLSVRAAIAVMQAKGSDRVAKAAANAVLAARKSKRPTTSLHELATEVSVAVMKAGGSHEVAAATTVAIMDCKDDAQSTGNADGNDAKSVHSFHSAKSRDVPSVIAPPSAVPSVSPSISPSVTRSVARSVTRSVAGSVAPSVARSTASSANQSLTPSMEIKRTKLRKKEHQITQRTKALERAEQENREKEKEIRARLAALDAAEVALLDEANIDLIVQDRMAEYGIIKGNPHPGSQNHMKLRFNAPRGSERLRSPRQLRGRSRSKDNRDRGREAPSGSGPFGQKVRNRSISLFSRKSKSSSKSAFSNKSKKSLGTSEKSQKTGQSSILKNSGGGLLEI